MPLRVAAISFLNPAPLLYDFEHEPSAHLKSNYTLHYTTPANCARELHSGNADLGLIPIAELTPDLAIVPGCTIASLDEVRSILLLIKNPKALPQDEAIKQVRSLAADAVSRSSQAYAHILFQHFHHTTPTFHQYEVANQSNPIEMLAHHDAALLIGDPALLAREHKAAIDPHNQLLWLDLAQLWRQHTGLPWVAAVWSINPAFLTNLTAPQLISDLTTSRDHGLANISTLVAEWSPRLAIPPATIHHYLTQNIHYTLDGPCLEAIHLFRHLATLTNTLPPLPHLNILDTPAP